MVQARDAKFNIYKIFMIIHDAYKSNMWLLMAAATNGKKKFHTSEVYGFPESRRLSTCIALALALSAHMLGASRLMAGSTGGSVPIFI